MVHSLVMTTRLLLLSFLLTFTAFGQSETMLTASLKSEQREIAPGKPFQVAITLSHAPKAHTYWLNPGGPGRPTSFTWTLPEGFSMRTMRQCSWK
jgi:DsbC/DsbD-like thiol-disulfide interchange protein